MYVQYVHLMYCFCRPFALGCPALNMFDTDFSTHFFWLNATFSKLKVWRVLTSTYPLLVKWTQTWSQTMSAYHIWCVLANPCSLSVPPTMQQDDCWSRGSGIEPRRVQVKQEFGWFAWVAASRSSSWPFFLTSKDPDSYYEPKQNILHTHRPTGIL